MHELLLRRRSLGCRTIAAALTAVVSATCLPLAMARTDGQLKLTVVDAASGEPMPVRLELRDARNRLARLKPPGTVVAGDGVYFSGDVLLELRRGRYSLLLEAGPEYQTFFTQPGTLEIVRGADDAKEIAMTRRVDMHEEGWYAGDLDVQSPDAGLGVVMAARGVDVAPRTVVANRAGKCEESRAAPAAGQLTAALDQRRGGGLLFVSAESPVDVCQWKDAESTMAALQAGRDAGAVTIARQASAWDLPLWVAGGQLDAVQILHAATPKRRGDEHPVVRPLDRTFFPGKEGPGRYAESIYHQLLECGLRITPAAGTAAGETNQPLGANRVYVHCGEQFTPDEWLGGLRSGAVVVTNGPLLRPLVQGQPPGAVFHLPAGTQHSFQIGLNLAFYAQTHIEYLEIVKNGSVLHTVRLDELAQAGGKLPEVPFDGSGWFLVRAVTDATDRYEYATSGAWFVEQDYQPRISRTAAEYFLTWLDDLSREFADDANLQADVAAARPFWEDLRSRANAD